MADLQITKKQDGQRITSIIQQSLEPQNKELFIHHNLSTRSDPGLQLQTHLKAGVKGLFAH